MAIPAREATDITSAATESFAQNTPAGRDSDRMKLFVFGTEGKGQANLVAVLDNLGKGASGAAVQNMELMLGKAA